MSAISQFKANERLRGSGPRWIFFAKTEMDRNTLATLPGAGLPAHVKRRDWVLMPAGKSPVHSDADRDIDVQGYCFFQVVDG
jgi:hypothetical protein